ncbi:MAG: hypothetical protein LBJ19_00485 [Holosporaceae bacterium]|nr:hypothetical protein [Holosporaceae bacterium]
MSKVDLENFLDNFSELSDPRSSRNRLHCMDEILHYVRTYADTVTIDAAGYQHGIAKQIIEKDGNYILALH